MGFLKKIFKPVAKTLGFLFKPIAKILKKWLMPKEPTKEALKVERGGSDFFIPVMYGQGIVGGIKVDANVTDAAGGADNEFFHKLVVFCYGEIDSFVEFYFNGVSENDPRWLKDKNQPNGAKWFTKETRVGTVSQTAVSAVGKLNRFSADTSKYEGIALAFFTFQQDADQSIWNGEPEITAWVKGKKCYDPRNGQTVYTENPALHLLDYLKSSVYGKGLTDSDLNIPYFISVANTADTNETSTVNTLTCQTVNGVYSCTGSPAEVVNFKRFTFNGLIDTEQEHFSNIEEIGNSFRAFYPNPDGRFAIASEMESEPAFYLTADDVVSTITTAQPNRNTRYNRCIVRFSNIKNKFKTDEVCYPEPGSTLFNTWLNEDNGIVQELVIQAENTIYKAEAMQLARLAVQVSRNAETIQLTAVPRLREADVGDIFAITEENRGWVNRDFRISEINYRDDFFVDITGIQHDNGLYPWSDTPYEEIVGGSNLGDPTNIPAPTGLAITSDPTFATAGTLAWNIENNAFIRRYQIAVFNGPLEVYRTEVLGRRWAIPLFNVGSYSIQVRAQSTLNTLSPAATISINLLIPVAPTDINFTIGNFEIEARPVLVGIGLGTEFEFALNSTDVIRGRGRNITFTGLASATEYTVFARTINALGTSGWFSKIVTTTANAGPILDLIGEDIAASVFDDVVAQIQANLDTIVAEEVAALDLPTTIEVQTLIDDSIALVNESDADDPRVNVVNEILAVIDERNNRAEIKRLDFTIASEKLIRASAILQLQATDAATLNQLQQVETDLEGNSEALNLLIGQVNNPTTGLSATFSIAQSAKTTSDSTATSFTILQGQVNNSTTGLTATYTIASQAKTTADGAASSVTTLQNQVNNPSNGLSATFTLAGSANSTANTADTKANNNATAIGTLQTRVSNAEGNISSAQLSLQSVTNELGVVSSRAFLGVTTVTSGRAVINGIVVDGLTNTLEFRADTLRLTNTAGEVQLYWDSGRGKFVYNGDLVAANFQTATSGYRAEMGTGTIPFWFGTGAKTWANANFAVDTSGNVKINNATMQGAFLSSADTGYRVEINNDPTYAIWVGSGIKNDLNGLFWVKFNGQGFIKRDFFVGQIVESKLGTASSTSGAILTATATNHISDGFPCEVVVSSYVSARANGNLTSKSFIVRLTVKRNGTTIGTFDTLLAGTYENIETETYWQGNSSATIIDTRTTAETRNYTVEVSLVGTATPFSLNSRTATIKTFENKVAT